MAQTSQHSGNQPSHGYDPHMRLKIISQLDEIAVCRKLVELGAKPPIIECITSLPKQKIRNIYQAITGAPNKPGPNKKVNSYFKTPILEAQSTLFLKLFTQLHDNPSSHPLFSNYPIIEAYEAFNRTCVTANTNVLIDVNQAYDLTVYMRTKDIEFHQCTRCGGDYLQRTLNSISDESDRVPDFKAQCPFCTYLANSYCSCGNRLTRNRRKYAICGNCEKIRAKSQSMGSTDGYALCI